MAFAPFDSVSEDENTENAKPLTEAEKRNAEHMEAVRRSATTGNGQVSTAPVNQRFKPEPVPRMQTPGMKVAAGPIADTPFDPPLDLHPAVIENIDGFEEHKGYLASAQTAFSIAFEGLKKISEGRERANRNPSWNDYQRLLQVGGFADKMHTQMTKAFDGAADALTKGIDHIERELSQPLTNGASSPFAKEIREHVKSLKPDERGEFLAAAIRDNYQPAIEALLGVPHYISGLNKSVHDHHLRKYREQQKPELVGRQTAMNAALELIQNRAPRIHLHVESAMGGKFSTLKRVREANDAASKALAFEQGTNNPLLN